MKQAYPIILTPSDLGFVVYVPDLDINTEGRDIADAIDMAVEAIGLWGITKQDLGGEIPAPSAEIPQCGEHEHIAFALIDFDAFRRAQKVCERIQAYRNRLHLSQEYVANYLGVNRSTIEQMELGNRKITEDELSKFGVLFGVSSDTLLRGENLSRPSTLGSLRFDDLSENDQAEIMSLKAFALKHGYNHPEVKRQFKKALLEFNPKLRESFVDRIIQDLFELTDFTSPSIREKSLSEIAVGFYRACYLHAGWYEEPMTEGEAQAHLAAVTTSELEIQRQRDIAYEHLNELVSAVLSGSLCNAETIKILLNDIPNWCDDGDARFLELDAKLCRCVYHNYPQLVECDNLFKVRFLGPDEHC